MGSRKHLILPGLLLLVLGTALGMRIESFLSGGDTFQQLQKLQEAFVIISREYVDEVNPKQAAESAIGGMLAELDPHSSYISAEEIQEIQEGYEGSFGGVGILFQQSDDTARVISVVPDGPSEAVGVMAGDRIVAINDSSAIDLPDGGIQDRLKGPIGTTVRMAVRRYGIGEPVEFTITRGRIPLYSIESAYMLDNRTGFIRIDRFAATTYSEFMESLRDLKQQGMERLVLDLRDNPGGIMDAAVRIVDEMLEGGKTIVYTEGRGPEMNELHRSTQGGAFETQPIIVLVSPLSASASEIVAGALQDHDRALVVGKRTFGKGLVQRQFALPDGSVLQMTVARYFTPSGRLIQTHYEGGDLEAYYQEKFSDDMRKMTDPEEYAASVPDSLKFETAQGRLVFGGGGILPDHITQQDIDSTFWQVVNRGLDFTFLRNHFMQNEHTIRETWGERKQDFIASYEINDQTWQDFVSFVEREQANASEDVPKLTRSDLQPIEHRMRIFLKARLGQQLYGSRIWYPIYNEIDRELQEALRLWRDAEALAAYHVN